MQFPLNHFEQHFTPSILVKDHRDHISEAGEVDRLGELGLRTLLAPDPVYKITSGVRTNPRAKEWGDYFELAEEMLIKQ